MELTRTPIVWDVPEDMTYLVSNSEVANYLSCERKHYYAHALNIEPKNASTSLSRGVIGHEALAVFYETGSESKMQDKVDEYFQHYLSTQQASPGYAQTVQMFTDLKRLLERYVEFQKDDEWEILAVEKSFVMPLFDNFGYGMRLDLLVRFTKGPKAGEIWIVDHKFIYDFMNSKALQVNAQIPKYLATVRNDTGLVITGGILNQLRHRMKKGPMTDEELFRREPVTPSTKRIRNIMKEQIQASEEIMERHALPVDEYGQRAKRALNTMVCNNCGFFELCMTELEGQNPSLMIQTEFQPNSYGYNNGSDE